MADVISCDFYWLLMTGAYFIFHTMSPCIHNSRLRDCAKCGGSSICKHGRRRRDCAKCDGSSICQHGRRHRRCTLCIGASICLHGRVKYECKQCTDGGGKFCEHKRVWYQCSLCDSTFSHKRKLRQSLFRQQTWIKHISKSQQTLMTKYELPEDLLIKTDRKYPVIICIIIGGVKNPPLQKYVRAYMDKSSFVMPTCSEVLMMMDDVCTHGPPCSTAKYAYCSGVTYFCKTVLRLYSTMEEPQRNTPRQHKKSSEHIRQIEVTKLISLITSSIFGTRALKKIGLIKTGKRYIEVARILISILKQLPGIDSKYTTPRLTRSVLNSLTTEKMNWTGITCTMLAEISADTHQILVKLGGVFVTDVAKKLRCKEQFISLAYCDTLKN